MTSTLPRAAPDRPISPTARRLRTPSWLDLRLVLGVALVLASVAVGARVVASSDDRSAVWRSTRDLAAGTVLTSADVEIVRVHLGDDQTYLRASDSVVGQVASRPIGRREMVPRGALGDPSPATTVTIPMEAGRSPAVERGQRITVWVSTGSCRAVVVLPDVVVQDVIAPRSGGLSAGSTVALTVRVVPSLASRVVRALDLPSAVIRVGVLGGDSPDPAGSGAAGLEDLAACESTR
jgi:hypothetical protein